MIRLYFLGNFMGMALVASTVFAEEAHDLVQTEEQSQFSEAQYKEAALECRLEVLEEEEKEHEKEIDALQINNSLLEQEGNYLRIGQKRRDASKAERKRIEKRWEKDHSRE